MKRALLALWLLALPLAAQEQPPAFGETVDVVRYVIPARVVDPAGHAIQGLTPADFTASIGGKKAVVESVDWIDAAEDPTSIDPNAPRRGRLVVVFVQTDFARNPTRVTGQMNFNLFVRRVLDMLEPEDQVAVVSHDSHLKLQCDFTLDREVARNAVYDSINIRKRPLPAPPEQGASLARHLNAEEMQKASSVGVAMGLVARAMAANAGTKMVLLAGWGIGERVNRKVALDPKVRESLALFRNDHTPVVTLGTGTGGELSAGLMATAEETGGFYAATLGFADQTMTRLKGMLSGQYELVLRVEGELPEGQHPVDLRTTRRNARVLSASVTIVHATETVVENEVTITTPSDPAAPRTPDRLYVEAMQKLREGDAESADALLTRAIETMKAPDESWYERGLLLAARGEMEQAAADLRTYVERAPGGRHATDARELLAAWQ